MMRYTTVLLLLIVSPVLGQKPLAHSDQKSQVLKNMFEGVSMMVFLKDCSTKHLNSMDSVERINKLKKVNLYYSADSYVRIANDMLHFQPFPNKHLFESNDNLYTVYLEEFQNRKDLMERWRVIQPMQQVFWGYSNYYFKLDTLYNVSLNVMFYTKNHIVVIQRRFPFFATNYDVITKDQWQQINEANEDILNILHVFSGLLTSDADKIYAPTNGRLYPKPLTPTERLAGFIQFWTEVKYNFAFFDHVPDLNWDEVLVEYLPRFAKDQSTFDYYRLLSEVCSKLNDGHTNIYNPIDLRQENYYPNVELRNFDDGVYVVNTSYKYRDIIPLGSKIVHVNGEPISQYLQNYLFPYISASTSYVKMNIALQNLLEIPLDKKLNIGYLTPKGEQKKYQFNFDQDTTSWIIEQPDWFPLEFEILENNTAYIKINTFEREDIINEFVNLKDTIHNFKKLIIDLRENGGGNSSYGYEILKYFSPKPFLTSKWMTREHKAAYKAWGKNVEDPPSDQFEAECLLTYKGDFWYEVSPDTIVPYYDKTISIPVVILIGNNTASAAEDFLIAAESAGITETVGDFTYGSTGQPLMIRMPGGGSARICTKKDTYPNGKEFVGYGIKPKHLVKPNMQAIMERRDVVLEYALSLN